MRVATLRWLLGTTEWLRTWCKAGHVEGLESGWRLRELKVMSREHAAAGRVQATGLSWKAEKERKGRGLQRVPVGKLRLLEIREACGGQTFDASERLRYTGGSNEEGQVAAAEAWRRVSSI
jgi:hypothetical protein